jgi:hypothetical protein
VNKRKSTLHQYRVKLQEATIHPGIISAFSHLASRYKRLLSLQNPTVRDCLDQRTDRLPRPRGLKSPNMSDLSCIPSQ